MAQAKKTGKLGIDRWTNNGHGITAETPLTKKQVAALNAEIAKNKGGKRKNG